MSDGATYALQLGLKRPDLFPNIAAFSGMLDPSLLAEPPSPSTTQHIYWLHGHRDTMFPFELAKESVAALKTKDSMLCWMSNPDWAIVLLHHGYPQRSTGFKLRLKDLSTVDARETARHPLESHEQLKG